MAPGQISVRLNDEMKIILNNIQEENLLDDVSSTIRYLIRFYAKYSVIPRDILEELYLSHRPLNR